MLLRLIKIVRQILTLVSMKNTVQKDAGIFAYQKRAKTPKIVSLVAATVLH
jgi:hypothetical protein